MEKYEQLYKDALEKSKEFYALCKKCGANSTVEFLEDAFPELTESEDKRIRKEILEVAKTVVLRDGTLYGKKYNCKDWIAWLEKQGKKEVDPRYENLEELLAADDIYQMAMNDAMVEEAKSKAINALSELEISKLLGIKKQDKVNPKFNVGDWIVGANNVCKIIALNDDLNCYIAITSNNEKIKIPYYFDDGPGNMCSYHRWSIEDAKDGDILVYRNSATEIIMIFKSWSVNRKAAHTYFHIFNYDNYRINDSCDCGDSAHPATKEERDTIFARMREVGYDWDNEKKKLKKIEENSFEGDIVEKAIYKAGYEWSEDTHQLMKIEQKFKIGDWVVFNEHHEGVYQIEKIENFQYTLRHILGGSMPLSFSHEDMIRLWTIKDAKPGDVLYSSKHNLLWIYKNKEECHVAVNLNYANSTSFGTDIAIPSDVFPATKEQCDTLFAKMREAGYEWDANKKELKNIKSKFHVGDWIVSSVLGTAHIIGVNDYDEYQLEYTDGYITFSSIDYVNYEYDKWTIQDAKPGDIISNGKIIVIFKKFEDPSYRQHIVAYIGLDTNGNIQITDDTWFLDVDKAKLATKEERDTLFTKMREAGYEWDANKKEIN